MYNYIIPKQQRSNKMAKRTQPSKTFTIKTREDITKGMEAFWQGEIFAYNKKYGMCDELRIGNLLGIRYLSNVRQIVAGDFCLIK